MKNILESINSRQDNTEGQISDLEDGVADITQAKQEKRKKRILKNNDSLRDFRDNIKCTHFHVIGGPRRRKLRERRSNFFEEILAENFHNLEKEINILL